MKPFLFAILISCSAFAAEFHVAPTGNDANPGSKANPFKTIAAAANVAQPGDTITVHAGVYREQVNPPRGGTSDAKRITYQAAPGEKVVITGSEPVKGWERVTNNTWKVTIPNSFFGSFNPYSDVIHGSWFGPRGRLHHTGCVYQEGNWLMEAAKLESVLKPAEKIPQWFAQVDTTNTTIWAQFPGGEPDKSQIELNVRQTVFYPEKPFVNYITVRGLILENAAPNWAPPNAEQKAIIGTHWSKGWIVENNTVRYSCCTGISLGKYGDEWDNKSDTAPGFVETVNRALKNGWNKETVGSHIVRNNHIHHCEQAGIVGSMGGAFSRITGNEIHDIHTHRLFDGAEMAGIKLHGAIDSEISGNHIYRTSCGIWLDWMAQGTRISGNLLHDNDHPWDVFGDLLIEADHGPYLVDNNIMLSPRAVISCESHGGAYVHNYFGGSVNCQHRGARSTPVMKPHDTALVDIKPLTSGDTGFYNNLLAQGGTMGTWDRTALPMTMAGNVYLKGTKPSTNETAPLLKPEVDPHVKLLGKPDGWYLDVMLDNAWDSSHRQLMTTERLGKTKLFNLPFENPDGTPLRIDTDYLGKQRNTGNPFPGPFEISKTGTQTIKVWPLPIRRAGLE